MKLTYLLVNVFSVMVPFAFSFHPKIQFHKRFGAFFKANGIAAFLFLIWDAVFTAKGIWSFNTAHLSGLEVYNLPVEEILFFLCIPFCCVFTYHCSVVMYPVKWNRNAEKYFILLFSAFLFIIGSVFWHRAYTSVTCISTAILLLTLRFYFKADWLAQFFSVYPVLLIPFFIVNGILTGSGLETPVVYYNDAENLGIRLFTIPAEDVIYGMELILLNIFFYERFLKNRAITNNKFVH